MSSELANLSFNGSAVLDRGTGESLKLNATDMWRAAGSPENKRPVDWLRSKRAAEKVAFLGQNPEVEISHVWVERTQGGGSTWLHWTLALDYAEELSNEFWLWAKTAIMHRLQGATPLESGLERAVQATEACLMNITQSMAHLHAGLSDVGDKVAVVRDAVTALDTRVGGLEQQLVRVFDHKRKTPSKATRKAHEETIAARGGICPCCESVSLFDAAGKFIGEIDHHEKASNASVDATWPVCFACNRTGGVRATCQVQSYHAYRVHVYVGPLFNVRRLSA